MANKHCHRAGDTELLFKQEMGVAVHAFRPSTESAEASLVCTVSFRTARANKETCLRKTETDRQTEVS